MCAAGWSILKPARAQIWNTIPASAWLRSPGRETGSIFRLCRPRTWSRERELASKPRPVQKSVSICLRNPVRPCVHAREPVCLPMPNPASICGASPCLLQISPERRGLLWQSEPEAATGRYICAEIKYQGGINGGQTQILCDPDCGWRGTGGAGRGFGQGHRTGQDCRGRCQPDICRAGRGNQSLVE